MKAHTMRLSSTQRLRAQHWTLCQHMGAVCVALCFLITKSGATDEKISDQVLNNDKRFQQLMQGSSGGVVANNEGNVSSIIHLDQAMWPTDRHKFDKIDIEKEIGKLNTTYIYQSTWPQISVKLGSVTAVSFDKTGNVVIFHRCDRVWGPDTFSTQNVFAQRSKGPIRESTVLGLEREMGKLVYDWGKDLFYMPHGLSIDHEDNVWVTDVALHQIFKFGPRGSNNKPLMALGTAFTPGNGESTFCKPTSVAVLENGDFFVADGYCNARILKYSPDGSRILYWGQNTFSGVSYGVAPENFFAIPHALTLVPEQELVCTADRENGRVQCFFWSNGTFHSQYYSPLIGDRLFSMDYTPARGGQLIVVNGPTAELGISPEQYNEVRGYVMNFKSKKVIAKFGPNDRQFSNPHDVAVTMDGNEVYVAELSPTRIYRFLHKSLVKPITISNAKPTANLEDQDERSLTLGNESMTRGLLEAGYIGEDTSIISTHHKPGATAILVASLMLLFAFLTFGLALLIARRRRRGCMPFVDNSRLHAWDFSSKADGFKLGGLLMKRNKRSGFEKLDQNASDEEESEETLTNTTLSSAQFS